ncbi:MAG: hypothetical protein N2C12_14680 [Planctomycetales bacterium]
MSGSADHATDALKDDSLKDIVMQITDRSANHFREQEHKDFMKVSLAYELFQGRPAHDDRREFSNPD